MIKGRYCNLTHMITVFIVVSRGAHLTLGSNRGGQTFAYYKAHKLVGSNES